MKVPTIKDETKRWHKKRKRLLRGPRKYTIHLISEFYPFSVPTPNTGRRDVKYFWVDEGKIHKVDVSESKVNKSQVIGGGRGVMVIVVGNGHGDTSSNPRRDWMHFT